MNINEPAFPTDSEHQSGPSTWHYPGMTLRDYFAGQAMEGMLADHTVNAKPDRIAYLAYRMADAMLVERQKSQCTDVTVSSQAEI